VIRLHYEVVREAFGNLAGLGGPEEYQVSDLELLGFRRVCEQRRLNCTRAAASLCQPRKLVPASGCGAGDLERTLSIALGIERRQARWQERQRVLVCACLAAGNEAARVAAQHVGAARTRHLQRKVERRLTRTIDEAVEQVRLQQARADRHFGDRGVGAREPSASGSTAVEEAHGLLLAFEVLVDRMAEALDVREGG